MGADILESTCRFVLIIRRLFFFLSSMGIQIGHTKIDMNAYSALIFSSNDRLGYYHLKKCSNSSLSIPTLANCTVIEWCFFFYGSRWTMPQTKNRLPPLSANLQPFPSPPLPRWSLFSHFYHKISKIAMILSKSM